MFMQPVVNAAANSGLKMVYSDAENETVLRAVQTVVDEAIARPILVGRPDAINALIDDLGLRIKLGDDVDVINPRGYDKYDEYSRDYHQIAGRNGVSVERSSVLLRTDSTVIAAMALRNGDADGMICGKVGRFTDHFQTLRSVIGTQGQGVRASTLTTLLFDDGPLFLTDCFIDLDPTVDQIVSKTLLGIEQVRQFGITPRVALLSHSNFGSSNAESARKMRHASEILRAQLPDVEIDGEMHSLTALDSSYRQTIFADSQLQSSANLLVFPGLDAANIALGLLRQKANGLLIGPYMSGLKRPAHIMLNSATPRTIYNVTAIAVAEIVAKQG
jgi:malate dehydrogenase (oxaloacetate-decarboxylating)(NADP+)